jgi:hypothetical protein
MFIVRFFFSGKPTPHCGRVQVRVQARTRSYEVHPTTKAP